MVLSPSVQQLVLVRSKNGDSALEIAEELGLEFNEVYDLILRSLTAPQVVQREAGKPHSKRQPFTLDDVPQLFALLLRSATEYGHAGVLWTVPMFVATARTQCGIHISKRTVRRYQKKLGLTFEKQISRYAFTSTAQERVHALRLRHPRSLVFIIVSIRAGQHLGDAHYPGIILLGLSITGRIAATARRQSRVSTSIKTLFIRDLLALHPTHHVIIFAREVGPARGAFVAFERVEKRLHFVWCP